MEHSLHHNAGALHNEAPRRVFDEAAHGLQDDLRRYEQARLDKIRDLHVAYSKSAATFIAKGMPPETAMRIMTEEIPQAGFDRFELIPLLNYFLQEHGQSIQFDTSLNVHGENVFISSGDAETQLQHSDSLREDDGHAVCLHVAEAIAQRLVGGIPFEIIMTFAKGDIVWENMDNALVAHYLNDCLEALGSEIRVDRYLERVTYESFD